jgi:hypothetical protein
LVDAIKEPQTRFSGSKKKHCEKQKGFVRMECCKSVINIALYFLRG